IVLFELLTGRLPFSGQSPVSIALKHLQHDTPSVKQYNPDIPQSVENIVLQATAKDPFHRYESVYDMEDGLETALDLDRIDEERFVPPAKECEETKAIPIITENQIEEDANGDTIAKHPDENTKSFADEDNKVNDVKKGKKKKEKKKGKKQRKKKWLIISGILLILLTAAIVTLFFIPGLLQPKEVEIPDVSGMAYEEALADLNELNLDTERDEMYSAEFEADTVIRTEPEAGSTIEEDDTVTLVVSQGKETVAFDDYVGQNFDQVKRILENKGFENITANEGYSNEYNSGDIMNHVYPAPGTEVIPDEAEVIFDVSIGPEPITLRNLRGMSEEDAVNSLEE